MSRLIPLGRVPKSPDDRQALIAEEVAKEERLSAMGIPYIQKTLADYLVDKKGFRPEDIEIGREFKISVPECNFTLKADVLVTVEGRPFLHTKCAMASPESWERYAIAFSRAAAETLIPFAFVTDGEHMRLFDCRTCSVRGESISSIPSRDEALEILKSAANVLQDEKKRLRDRRILHAFAGLACTAETSTASEDTGTSSGGR